MLKVKAGSEAVVKAVIYCLTYGPISPAAMMFNCENIRECGCSESHVNLVCDQLVLVGAAMQLEDGRYIATSEGEAWLEELEAV